MFWRKKTTEPTPPTNVKLVLRDGSEVPVDTVYQGQDADGVHIWEVTNRRGDIKGATIEVLPPNTSVGFNIITPPRDDDAWGHE